MADALEFFNSLSGVLEIELTEPAQRAAPHLLNKIAPKDARITHIAMKLSVYLDNDARELSDEEWGRVVIQQPRIKICSANMPNVTVEHDAPNAKHFTVRDLAHAIATTEKESRASGEWLGGVDVHHIFFEGIQLEEDTWTVCWGS